MPLLFLSINQQQKATQGQCIVGWLKFMIVPQLIDCEVAGFAIDVLVMHKNKQNPGSCKCFQDTWAFI